MTENDHIKNKIKIHSTSSKGVLVVSATENSFTISLEGENAEIPPPCIFCIPKNSTVYRTFGTFFSQCHRQTPANVLIDEAEGVEHANLLLFKSTEKGLVLRFACEKDKKYKVSHLSSSPNKKLTDYYIKLFKDLHLVKRQNAKKQIEEMAMS